MSLYGKIQNAINEGLRNALISADDDITLSKSTTIKHSDTKTQIANKIAERCPATKDEFDFVVKHAWWQPDNMAGLQRMIKVLMLTFGPNIDLNWIDVSHMSNLSYLFVNSQFNGDISQWDVSNVTAFECMFYRSSFNGDISNWDMSSATNIACMFERSEFDGNINSWNIHDDIDMEGIFNNCPLAYHPPIWYKFKP